MLKRKESRTVATPKRTSRNAKNGQEKTPAIHSRVVLPSAKRGVGKKNLVTAKAAPQAKVATPAKTVAPVKVEAPNTVEKKPSPQLAAMINPTAGPSDLTETVKTLLHLAQEHGYVTY
ncbi:MAG: hypothetical protein DVB33_02040, partial [Verrucomicrobia bacterium]